MGFGAELGRVYVEVRAKMDSLKSDFDKATKDVDDHMRGMGQKVAKTGDTLSKTLTPVALAFAGASKIAFQEFDAGSDTIIGKTGAVGEELKSLEGVMKGVAGQTTSSFEEIGSAVGDLNAMLGLTGKPLEDTTEKLIKLKELGQPVDPQKFARFMGDWSIATDKAGESLDRMYTIAKLTGQPIDALLESIVQYGAPLRSLGFDMDQSAIMLAKWHKEGVNVETLLAGMKMGLGKIAKGMGDTKEAGIELEKAQKKYNEAVKEHGKNSLEARDAQLKLTEAQDKVKQSAGNIPELFQQTLKDIKGAKTEAEAYTIAIERFGKRAGPDFARAVLEGRFELEELTRASRDSKDSIDQSYEAAKDFGDTLQMWKNRIIGVLGPMGEYGMALGGIAAGIGPVMSLGGRLIQHFTKVGAAAAASAGPIAASGAASAASGTMAAAGSTGFWAMAAAVWATLAPVLAVIAVIALLIGAGYLLIRNWDTVKSFLGDTWDWLLARWRWVVGAILTLTLGPFGAVIAAIIGNWDKVKRLGGEAIDWLEERWDGFTYWLTNIPNRLGNWGSRMWSGMVDGLRSAWNAVARMINSLPSFTLPGIFGGGTIGLPKLPYLAEGGRAATAGLAVVGERGAETVWLPAGAEVDRRSRGRGPGAGVVVNQYIAGSVVTERQLTGITRGGLTSVSRYNAGVGF